MHVNQSMSEDALPHTVSGSAPPAAQQPLALKTTPSVERLRGIDQTLRQTAQLVSLITGQLEANELNPATPAQGLLEQLDATVEHLLSRFNTPLDLPSSLTERDRHDAVDFPVQTLFKALAQDCLPLAVARRIKLRIVPCSAWVRSLPEGLRQVLSSLMYNLMHANRNSRLTLGARRHLQWLSLELWCSGCESREAALRIVSMPVHAPFLPDAYGRAGALSTYELSAMLGAQLQVRYSPGKATLISISVPSARSSVRPKTAIKPPITASHRLLLVVEPQALLREMLCCGLGSLGYQTAAVSDGAAALAWLARSGLQPDLVLTEHALAPAMDGVQLVQRLRDQFNRTTPAIVLTADTQRQVAHAVLAADCMLLRKPVSLNTLRATLGTALSAAATGHAPGALPASSGAVIYVVDEDEALRNNLRRVLEAQGYPVRDAAGAEQFFERYPGDQRGCLVIEARPSGISGLEVVGRLRARGDELPIIMISGNSRVADVVDAMKAGVCDFIEKPFRYQQLLTSLTNALANQADTQGFKALRQAAIDHISHLTPRQRQIMEMVLDGHPSKNIAFELGISQRTVEKHRASIMSRTEAKSIPELARIALAAGEKALSAAGHGKGLTP
ncbi:response regulator [Pseudomonas sp. OVF7]|uniref:response regulator n=1 Tax=unclassified Pseudomonas TaxID=196821 RepID=UPI00272CD693|nr:response regulator [Pseudomonas sp. OVF7]WLD64432.1 response regulator [Pseudomonas sp. OVF7]